MDGLPPAGGGGGDTHAELAAEIGTRCRDMSVQLEECGRMLRGKDDLIRDDGAKIDELDVKMHKFQHHYDWLDAKLKKLEEEQDEVYECFRARPAPDRPLRAAVSLRPFPPSRYAWLHLNVRTRVYPGMGAE